MMDSFDQDLVDSFENFDCCAYEERLSEPSSIFSDSEKENLVKFILKSWSFGAVFFKDKQPDFYKVVKSNDKVSKLMFPMVIQAIKTGSRADQIYLDTSGLDYMYEVGPMMVATNTNENIVHQGNGILFLKCTKNVGFYTIFDKDGEYIYPVAMQTKLAPIVQEVKRVALLKETSAALPVQRQNFSRADEDSVIALKCMEWPDDIWKELAKRNPKILQDIMPTLKDTPLHVIPKSHPKSDNPWVEWRISFSLIEKEIYLNVPVIFRKVYLLCKTLSSEWKTKFKFHSYILKTVFLWKYEEWVEQGKVYSESDTIDMILDIFSYLLKCYENEDIPMYFVPEMNLMEQYSRIKQDELIDHLQIQHRAVQLHKYRGDSKKKISRSNFKSHLTGKSDTSFLQELEIHTKKSSLVETIRKSFRYPFHPFVTRLPSLDQFEVMPKCENRMISQNHPSHQNIAILYKEKILKNNGTLGEEEELDLQCELYITFLFLLHEKFFCPSSYDFVVDYIFHILYLLKVFAGKNILEKDLEINFIKKYCESIELFSSVAVKFYPSPILEVTKEPYLIFLEQKFNEHSTHYIKTLNLNEANIGKLFINGSLDEDLYLLFINNKKFSIKAMPYCNKPRKVILRKGIYQYGDKNRSEELQKLIEKTIFWQENKLFMEFVEVLNKHFTKKVYTRYLNEAKKEKERKASKDSFVKKESFLLRHLLPHMCEMYNYGFTDKKFMLPTPAVYIFFLSQLLLNLEEFYCETKIVYHAVKRIPDKWGYTVKEGDHYIYRTYDERKHNTFLCNVQFVEM